MPRAIYIADELIHTSGFVLDGTMWVVKERDSIEDGSVIALVQNAETAKEIARAMNKRYYERRKTNE